MIGSASLSLCLVAEGVFDAYYEKNIMIWDVAAGLAILKYSGGSFKIKKTSKLNCIDVIAASNKEILNNMAY